MATIVHLAISSDEGKKVYHAKYKSGVSRKITADMFHKLVGVGYPVKILEDVVVVRVTKKVVKGRAGHYAVMSDGTTKKISKAVYETYSIAPSRSPSKSPSKSPRKSPKKGLLRQTRFSPSNPKSRRVTWGENSLREIPLIK
jgi:hypothetical protein